MAGRATGKKLQDSSERLIVKSIKVMGRQEKCLFLIGFLLPKSSFSLTPPTLFVFDVSRLNLKCECVWMPLMLMCFFSIPFIICFLRLMFFLSLAVFQVNFLQLKYLRSYHWQHSAVKNIQRSQVINIQRGKSERNPESERIAENKIEEKKKISRRLGPDWVGNGSSQCMTVYLCA